MVRKFLYVIAALTVLFLAARLALTFWGGEMAGLALVPRQEFERQAPVAANAYASPGLWLSRPGQGPADPARFRPAGLAADEAPLPAAVFFVHPTSYFDRAHWNAPLADPQADQFAATMIRGMASAFNASEEIWAPRYRQATMGAFLADGNARLAALDLAYADVREAFRAFLRNVPGDRPIVLAGHSQGALLVKQLLRDEVAGRPLARRIAAAYVVGWPVSLQHDLPAMGLPACSHPAQAGCVLGWLTFAEPAETKLTLRSYGRFPALDGQLPAGTPFLCTNPLTGTQNTAAPASANRGTLMPDAGMTSARLLPAAVPARCGPDNFLLIGDPPAMGSYVLPGNNYHIYDIPLFWGNVRADVAARVASWQAGRTTTR
ncbi:MAG: DUF3089 domain-containing protein [Pseudomonadota bacterium]